MGKMSSTLSTVISLGGLPLALIALTAPASALPKEGTVAPNATLEDADGRPMELKSLKGRPIIIVYEGKESAQQNQALKGDLASLAKTDRYKSLMALTTIADVSNYDFWPAKGIVKDAVRAESKKSGSTIYCDWSGAFRSTYTIRRGVSNVILVGKDGHVLFAAEGTLSAPDRKRSSACFASRSKAPDVPHQRAALVAVAR